jgi:uncharacterized protein YbjT (DUF2867 family)
MLIVTDTAGPIGSLVAEALLKAGERIRVTGSDPGTFKQFAALGAEAITCDPTDEDRLTSIFQGGCGIYLALPHESKYREDFCDYQKRVAGAYARAIQRAGIRHVVTQSSVGVHLDAGNWLLAGLRNFEESLNSIAGLNVLHLRPAHFLENLGAEILPTMNLLIGAIAADLPLSIVIPQDVANYAARRLMMLDFSGHSAQELLGAGEITMRELAHVIGKSLEKPGMKYVQLARPAVKSWLSRVGLPPCSAGMVLDLWDKVNDGKLQPLEARVPNHVTPTSVERFVAQGSLRPSLPQPRITSIPA